MICRSRLIPIPDLRDWYPHLGFSGEATLVTRGEPILVTDPIYLADVYNDNDDPIAKYMRVAGVIVSDFGGDTSCPVWWSNPFLFLPTSVHADVGGSEPPCGATVLAESVGCDSASFLFLVMRSNMPLKMQEQIETVCQQQNGVLLDLPAGKYSFWLEQIEGYPQANMAGLYRNIVAERGLPNLT